MKKGLLLSVFLLLSFLVHAQEPQSLSLSVFVDNRDNYCNAGISNAFIYAYPSGGVPPYSFLWSTGSTSDSIYQIPAGIYSVTVTDSLNDTVYGNATIVDYLELDVWALDAMPSCIGDSTGSVTVAAFGTWQPPPFEVIYQNLGNGNIVAHHYNSPGMDAAYNLAAGNYSITMINSLGCSGHFILTMTELPDFIDSVTHVTSACNGQPNGTAIATFNPNGVLPVDMSTIYGFWYGNPSTATFYISYSFLLSVSDSVGNVVATHYLNDTIFNNLYPGNYTLNVYPFLTNFSGLPTAIGCTKSYSFTVPDLGNNCGSISGDIFADYDDDCVKNNSDISLQHTLLEFNPGAYFVNSDNTGHFNVGIPFGTYSMKQYAPYYFSQHCPDTMTFTVTIASINPNAVIDVADSVLANPDSRIDIGSYDRARQGFNFRYSISLFNSTPNICPPSSLTFNYDTLLTFSGAYPAPFSVSPGQIIWNVDTLSAFYSNSSYHVDVNIPSSTPLGTQFTATGLLQPSANDANPANNNSAFTFITVGSFDPNEKSVLPKGLGAVGYIFPDDSLEYTVYFQNTGTDTAFNITIIDTLSYALDMTTLIPGAASHNYAYEILNPHILKFTFSNIQLADSNTNEPLSHGFVKYKIRQQNANTDGTEIKNTAAIYFDFNNPVLTNTTLNTVSSTTGTATLKHEQRQLFVIPNPAQSQLNFFITSTVNLYATLQLINSYGQPVWKNSIEVKEGTNNIFLNVKNLPRGIYFLQFGSLEKTESVKVVLD